MADSEWVEITHPDVDGSARVATRSVDHWRSRGWVVAPPAPPRVPAAKATATPKTTPAPLTATEEKAEG